MLSLFQEHLQAATDVLLRWFSELIFILFSIFIAILVLFAVYKLIGFDTVGAAGENWIRQAYTTVKSKGQGIRLFSTGHAGLYSERWDKVNLQPLILVEWLHANCPDQWHKWVAKATKKEVNELLVKQSTGKQIAWKVSVSSMQSSSPVPSMNGITVCYDKDDPHTMVVTGVLSYWNLDGGPPLGVLVTCTGQYKGTVSEVKAVIRVLKLDVTMQLRISPHEEQQSSSTTSDHIPRFSFELSTVSCKSLQMTSELLSGSILDKNEEVKLKSFLVEACEDIVRQCNIKLSPPQLESARYSNAPLEEQMTSGLSRSFSGTSLNHPIGGGMSLDMLPKQLVVEVIEGHRLTRKGKDYSDSFCTLEVDYPEQKSQNTTIVRKAFSPEWNEAFVFDITEDSKCLTVSVFHHDVIRRNEFLGRGRLALSNVTDDKSLTKTLFLEGRASDVDGEAAMGSVTVRLHRKSIPQLSKIKRFKSSPSVAASQSLRELRNRGTLSQSLDFSGSFPASAASTPGSPPDHDGGLVGKSLSASMLAGDFTRKSRAESPAIRVESPSDGTDDESITVSQSFEAAAPSSRKRYSAPAVTMSPPSVTMSPAVTVSAELSDDAAHAGSGDDELEFPSPMASNGTHHRHLGGSPQLRPRTHSATMAMAGRDGLGVDIDRHSSGSGVSAGTSMFSTLVVETDEDPPRHFLIPAGQSKRPFTHKGQKLHIYNNHTFVATHFSSRQGNNMCETCNKTISGFGKQGYRCRDCGTACHKKCHCFVEGACAHSNVRNMNLIYWEMEM